MKQLVIFDLDGTLLNTIDDLGLATNYALTALGFTTHPIEKLRAVFTQYYDEHCTDHSEPYPGIPELLKELQSKGVKLAVASNKYHEAVVKLISHYFPEIEWNAIMGQKEGVPVKPDPSIVFEILSCWCNMGIPARKRIKGFLCRLYRTDSGRYNAPCGIDINIENVSLCTI